MEGKENKDDRMTHEEAENQRVLIREDLCRAKFAKTKHLMIVAQLDTEIAASELALADIDRREMGVQFPPAPKEDEPKAPTMGAPVGGKKE